MLIVRLAELMMAAVIVGTGTAVARRLTAQNQAYATHVRLSTMIVGLALVIASGWIWLSIAASALGLFYSLAQYRATLHAWCRPMAGVFAVACIGLTGTIVTGSSATDVVDDQRRQQEALVALESQGLGRHLAAHCEPGTVMAVVMADDPMAELRTEALRQGLGDHLNLMVQEVGVMIETDEGPHCQFTADEWIRLTRKNAHLSAIVSYAGLPDDLPAHTVASDASYGDPDRWDWRPAADGAPLVIVGRLSQVRAGAVRSGRILAVLARNPSRPASPIASARYSESTFAQWFVIATPDNIADTAPILRLDD